MTQRHFRSCTLCEAMCGIVVNTEGPTVTRIEADRDDPFSRGYICPKAAALKDLHDDPDRLRTPLRRQGGRFVSIPWEQAFDEVGAQLRRIRKQHGRDAVAFYQGNPTVHNWGLMLFGLPFAESLHTRNRFSATSVDQLPHMLAAYLMFGHQLLLPVPDVDRTDFMLMLGANPAVSNGSLMTAPGIRRRLRAIQRRGGRVVVIDPRRGETAALASEHHFIRPGSDALLLAAMLRTLLAESLIRPGHLAPLLRGMDRLSALLAPLSPERVAPQVGIRAEVIRRLAHELYATERAVVYGRMGVSTQDFGALCAWLINLLNIVTGHLDREGGAMFTQPALDLLALPAFAPRGHFDRYRSRVRALPEFGGELPAVTLAEEIETPGPGQIRALITSAGNPVLSTPNGARLSKALDQLELMVAVDIYLNETTRHAHYILPPTGPLEHDHYDLALHVLAVRDTAKYSPAVFARPREARHDWEIYNALAWRLAETPRGRLLSRAAASLLGWLGPRGLFDLLLRTGPRGDRFMPWRRGLSLKQLERQPHGIDLGPLQPCLPARLPKEHGGIDLAPEVLVRDLRRLEDRLSAPASAPGFPLMLIGRRQLRSNNSWMHNSPQLIKGPERCTLEMHPEDAGPRGLYDGNLVEVRSRVGAVRLPLSISESVMPGVVSMPHGFGHGQPRTALRVANQRPGVSINDLTDERRIDLACGNASLNGVSVEVCALAADVPMAGALPRS